MSRLFSIDRLNTETSKTKFATLDILSAFMRIISCSTRVAPDFFGSQVGDRVLQMVLLADDRSLEVKRAKPSLSEGVKAGSKIFQLYRTIGQVSAGIPGILQYRGSKPSIYLTTSIGKSFHIYDCDKISLLFVGPTFDHEIVSLACHEDYTVVGLPEEIVVCQRGKLFHRIELQDLSVTGRIVQIQSFGSSLFVCYENSFLDHFLIPSGELKQRIELSFSAVHLLHPSSYLDKLLIAGPNGKLELWNVEKDKCIFSFDLFSKSNCQITSMQQSPVIDIVAVGLNDGTVVLLNIKTNKLLFKLSHPTNRICCISFRSHQSKCHVAVGDDQGSIYIWDLNEKRIIHTINNAHSLPIHTLEFLASSGIILSSSSDNQIKQWTYEETSNSLPQLLKHRAGHQAQPSYFVFYGDEHPVFVSGSRDHSLRMFHLDRDEQNSSFSQGKSEHHLSPITQISVNPMKSKQWDDILTCHEGEPYAVSWRFEHKRIGSGMLLTPDGSLVKCATISSCGNFAILGCSSGSVCVYNIQSRLLRSQHQIHNKSVTSVLMNSSNRTLFSSSLDCTVTFSSFPSFKPVSKLTLPSVAHLGVKCESNELLAVACDSHDILILDFEMHAIVRTLSGGHTNRITSLVFSPDGRWLISGSCDQTIKTWDIPTGCLIDILDCSSVPVGLAFSPLNDYLISAHSGSVGFCQWSNMVHFCNANITNLSDQLESVSLLGNSSCPSTGSPSTWKEGLQFSGQPKSKWESLFYLEQIKQRNKPKKKEIKTEEAPFFLSSTPTPITTSTEEKGTSESGTVVVNRIPVDIQFSNLLNDGKYEELVQLLSSATVSFNDLHIRTLSLEDDQLNQFLSFLLYSLEHGTHFDAIQAWLFVFLDEYSSILLENWSQYDEQLSRVTRLIEQRIIQLDGMLSSSLCLVNFNLKKK